MRFPIEKWKDSSIVWLFFLLSFFYVSLLLGLLLNLAGYVFDVRCWAQKALASLVRVSIRSHSPSPSRFEVRLIVERREAGLRPSLLLILWRYRVTRRWWRAVWILPESILIRLLFLITLRLHLDPLQPLPITHLRLPLSAIWESRKSRPPLPNSSLERLSATEAALTSLLAGPVTATVRSSITIRLGRPILRRRCPPARRRPPLAFPTSSRSARLSFRPKRLFGENNNGALETAEQIQQTRRVAVRDSRCLSPACDILLCYSMASISLFHVDFFSVSKAIRFR